MQSAGQAESWEPYVRPNIGSTWYRGHDQADRKITGRAEWNFRNAHKAGASHHVGETLIRMDAPSGNEGAMDEEIPVLPLCIISQKLQGISDNTPEGQGEHICIDAFRHAQAADDECHQHRANLDTVMARALSESEDGLIC